MTDQNTSKSALQDNIERKGGNAYYFAHAHKATGPQWDGKPEPKLLGKHEVHEGHRVTKKSFEYDKSNITTYAFMDDGMKVKLYIEMEGVGEKITDDDVSLDFTDTSLCLVIKNFKPEPQCLSFGRLTAEITGATFRVKPNKVILTLSKKNEGEWHTINDKGAPDHDLV
jgi:hypothetical protein